MTMVRPRWPCRPSPSTPSRPRGGRRAGGRRTWRLDGRCWSPADRRRQLCAARSQRRRQRETGRRTYVSRPISAHEAAHLNRGPTRLDSVTCESALFHKPRGSPASDRAHGAGGEQHPTSASRFSCTRAWCASRYVSEVVSHWHGSLRRAEAASASRTSTSPTDDRGMSTLAPR